MPPSRTNLLASARHPEGWDTALAQPFNQVAKLPRIFTASNRVETFSASDRDGKYWLVRESAEKLWLYSRDNSRRKFGRHYFHPDWLLRGSTIYQAIVSLTELIKNRKAVGELTLDISGFKEELQRLRSTVSLVGPPARIQLHSNQALAIEYLCLSLGIGSVVRLYVHENLELHGSGARYRLSKPLPAILHCMRPALEVWQHDRGNLFDLRAPFVEIGPIEDSGSPIEQMKAFRRLFDGGLSDEVAKALDQYATRLRRVW